MGETQLQQLDVFIVIMFEGPANSTVPSLVRSLVPSLVPLLVTLLVTLLTTSLVLFFLACLVVFLVVATIAITMGGATTRKNQEREKRSFMVLLLIDDIRVF